jgi:kynurenine formamidase
MDRFMRPSFEELPVLPGSDLRHAWDVFGDQDAVGTLNFLTEECRREAMTAVRNGIAVNLSLPLNEPKPSPFGRRPLQHEVFQTSSFSWDDRITTLDMQASTQWDGLLHVRHREFGFYGGRLDDPVAADKLGIDRWVDHGMVGRGVLLDVQHHFDQCGRAYDPLSSIAVSAQDLQDAAATQDVILREGDILLLRFGWYAAFQEAEPGVRSSVIDRPSCAGLHAGESTARFLWDTGIAAIACDNPSVEVQPGDKAAGYLHHRLLTMLGMPLGELFALDELSRLCRQFGRWDFLFASVPLNVPGAIGSPANAVAML